MKKKIIYGLCTLHLAIISLTILHGLEYTKAYGILERPLGMLTTMNYSAWRFGFFTPNVGNSTQVDIHLKGRTGEELHYSTAEDFKFFTSNHESANRFYGHKVHSSKDTIFMDLAARSMCTYILNEHREMNEIQYTMKGIRYPEMSGFAKDSAILREDYYSVTFSLGF